MFESDPIPTIMKWRFKQLKKLVKETVTMTPIMDNQQYDQDNEYR